MRLFHTGFQELPQPDLTHGRSSADFGRGFYTSPDEAFCLRWARTRRDAQTWLNVYDLDTEGLRVKVFTRDGEWFDYIDRNRAGYPDSLEGWDVIRGPIANDTIYDVWGVTTGGALAPEIARALLSLGPVYTQTVLKTPKALARLQFRSARVLDPASIAAWRQTIRREEETYQEALLRAVELLTGTRLLDGDTESRPGDPGQTN